jgi:hypothetical protein
MGFNGVEHAVVPADLARDIHGVRPEWVCSLLGLTDQEAPAEALAPEATAPAPAAAGAEPAAPTSPPDDGTPLA